MAKKFKFTFVIDGKPGQGTEVEGRTLFGVIRKIRRYLKKNKVKLSSVDAVAILRSFDT